MFGETRPVRLETAPAGQLFIRDKGSGWTLPPFGFCACASCESVLCDRPGGAREPGGVFERFGYVSNRYCQIQKECRLLKHRLYVRSRELATYEIRNYGSS